MTARARFPLSFLTFLTCDCGRGGCKIIRSTLLHTSSACQTKTFSSFASLSFSFESVLHFHHYPLRRVQRLNLDHHSSNSFRTTSSTNMSSASIVEAVLLSPTKRKNASPSVSPCKKPMAMDIENIPSDGILKQITGNQLISIGTEAAMDTGKTEKQSQLLFKKMSENAYAPTKGSKLAAGFDLKSAYEYTVPKRGSCLVKTDIQIQLPSGTYGRVAPRSGLALKNQIDVGAGVIDEDYRGNVGVILFNHGDVDFSIAKGDRIAQLICEKICYPEIVEVESLEDSDRGSGGFGSTGVKNE